MEQRDRSLTNRNIHPDFQIITDMCKI